MKYLFDTNALAIRLKKMALRENFDARFLGKGHELFVSVVTLGELEALSIRDSWHPAKKAHSDELLTHLTVIPLGHPDIVKTYAQMDAYSLNKLPGKPLPARTKPHIMGRHDLWIAATAHVMQAKLVTADSDFDHLEQAGWVHIERINKKVLGKPPVEDHG